MTPRIGVVGASGAVGAAAARSLADHGHPVHLVGRRADRLDELADRLGGASTAVADLSDPDGLDRACSGCAVVVNCAGPSRDVGNRVAAAAARVGADYVDAAGDETLTRLVTDAGLPPPGRVAVLAAGFVPGLSGLLPRYLAGMGFQRAASLTGYAGGLDRFTPAAAADYLASLADGYGVAGTAWRDGRPAAGAVAPRLGEPAPFFPGPVNAYPYLSGELAGVARRLGLRDLTWFNVFDGEHAVALLGRVRPGAAGPDDAERLCRAAAVDLAGRRPYQLFALQLDGVIDGAPATRSLLLRATDAYRVSGAVAAVAAQAIVDGAVPSGLHQCAEVLDPDAVLVALSRQSATAPAEVFDAALPAVAAVEEGVL
jgi:uncharacterized protein YbjT (DUF2867 family)